jgi:predicted AlkP superfamily phosphohydrolase/phosphomutase
MDATLFIGLDGSTFSILDPLMANGTMPFLQEFIRQGVRANLLSTSNPLTPPAWTSMMTGRSPGNHGIFDFIWAEERKQEVYFTLYNFRDIQSETIWSLVSRQQGKVCSLNFPMMSPPPEVNGYIIPGLVSWKHLRRYVHPQAFFNQLKSIPGFDLKELSWDFELEKKAEKGMPEEEYENWVDFHIRRERQWFNILSHLMKHDPCDLTGIIFDGADKILHIGWRFLDPALVGSMRTPWEKHIRSLCLRYFSELDGFLAEAAALAGPDCRIFLGSDHGFGPSWEVFRVNAWLHSQGYLAWKEVGDLAEQDIQSYKKLMDRHFVLLDWDNTTAYARTATSNGIYIRVSRNPGQTGIPPSQYESFRAELIEKLRNVVDPVTGEPVIKSILTKEEAYPGSHNDLAPDLTVATRDHSFLSVMNKNPVLYRRPEIEGTHYPLGIFAARGPGIRQGVTLPQASILEVAPALIYSLNLDIPEDFERPVNSEIFEPTFLQKNPIRIGAPTQPPESYALRPDKASAAVEEDEEIYKQLKALGYVE